MTWIQSHFLLSLVLAFLFGQFSMVLLLGIGRSATVGDELAEAEFRERQPRVRARLGYSG
jgi:hypothetical protein